VSVAGPGEARDRGAEVVVVAGLLDELHHIVGAVVRVLGDLGRAAARVLEHPEGDPAAEKSVQLGAVQVPVLPDAPPVRNNTSSK